MLNAMGLINLYEDEKLLGELTEHRPLAALPFGGRYRLIDFPLSNLVNSGIRNVGILVRQKYRPLTDHLRSGKEWDLARKRDGLFILPPANTYYSARHIDGDVENFYYHSDYIKSSRQKYVIICGSNMLCNIDFGQVVMFHEEHQADITIVYKPVDFMLEVGQTATMLDIGPDGRILDIRVNTVENETGSMSLNMYIMDKELLLKLVHDAIAHGGRDFIIDCLLKNICKLKIYGYCYKGYLARVYSTKSYYNANLDLLNYDKWKQLFFQHGLIYTKVKDAAPAIYKDTSLVSDALVANGCVIEGQIMRSVLFRGVHIKKNAKIKNSIIMQKSIIEQGAILENVICDKDVHITAGRILIGDEKYPLVIKKGTVI